VKRSSTISTIALVASSLLYTTVSALAAQQRPVLELRKLTTPAVIADIPCAPTGRSYAQFYPSGQLASCPLAVPTVLAGHSLPAKTWVRLAEGGGLVSVWLPQDTYLGAHLCRGSGDRGWSVEFHPTGALRLCYLAHEEVIDGVPCQKGSFWNELRGGNETVVRFREDGRLERCQAAHDFTRNGVAVRKWAVVHLDATGGLRLQ
jgi:hypothetical protein